MLGKIVWFGGFNNQKNKVNNFGFIAPLGEENTGDIRVDRDDVPLDIQETGLWTKKLEKSRQQ